MSINEGLMSSNSDLWGTPQAFFDKLNDEFHFTTDVCANKENAKCQHYFTKEEDGLTQAWYGTCWMNPPYGRVIGKWVQKAYESSLAGATVVCLLPARTDTKWWHEYCMKGEIRFVKGRLKFEVQDRYLDWGELDENGQEKQKYRTKKIDLSKAKPNSAPFPSAVVIFGEKAKFNTLKAIIHR